MPYCCIEARNAAAATPNNLSIASRDGTHRTELCGFRMRASIVSGMFAVIFRFSTGLLLCRLFYFVFRVHFNKVYEDEECWSNFDVSRPDISKNKRRPRYATNGNLKHGHDMLLSQSEYS